MFHRLLSAAALLLVLGLGLTAAPKDTDPTQGLKPGTVTLKSAGPLAFAPKGVLLVGDPQAATIYAIDTGDNTAEGTGRPKVEGIDEKIASLLGTEAKGIQVNDLAVNPISGNTYLSVARGRGPNASAVILKLSRDGKLSEFDLKDRKSAKATLPNPPAEGGKAGGKGRAPRRQDSITKIGYLNGRVIVAGLSNEEFASNLRSIPFPFESGAKGTNIEMYHGAHGKFETHSPIRVFTTYKIDGEDHLLAAYTCTPLVKIPVKKLEPGAKLMATTVAELGNRNSPLSIIVYNKGGKDYALIANNARGLMKVSLDGVDKIEGITSRISGTAGLKYETIKELTGVQRLDAFDKDHAVLLIQDKGGAMKIDTVDLP
ncbi:MAG: hypothetical protein U0797_10205 [Gemmataceae bacterium]